MPSDKLFAGNTITDSDPLQIAITGGGAVAIADGGDAALGAKADAAAQSGTVSLIALIKFIAAAIKAEDVAHASGDPGVMLFGVRQTTTGGNALSDTDGDYTPVAVSARGHVMAAVGSGTIMADALANGAVGVMDTGGSLARALGVAPSLFNGTTHDRQRVPAKFTTVALGAATAETTIWTPGASKKFRLMGGVLTASAQTVLTFKDNIGGTTILIVELAANTPFNLGSVLGNGILSVAANNVLTVTRGTSAALNGTLCGTEE
jgi:hypothetical protein